jgi:hypothetical protein
VKPTQVCVSFRRIWRGHRDFRLDSAKTSSGSFGVGANGLVIGVGFSDSGLCFCVWISRVSGEDVGISDRIRPKPALGRFGLELTSW